MLYQDSNISFTQIWVRSYFLPLGFDDVHIKLSCQRTFRRKKILPPSKHVVQLQVFTRGRLRVFR